MDFDEEFELFMASAKTKAASASGSQTASAGGAGAEGSARPVATMSNQGCAPAPAEDTDGG